MRYCIIILCIMMIVSCELQNPVSHYDESEVELARFLGDLNISSGRYLQKLEVDADVIEYYCIKPYFLGDNSNYDIDEEGWLKIDGSNNLNVNELEFSFDLEAGKVVNAIEYLDLCYILDTGETTTLRLADCRIIGTTIVCPSENAICGNCLGVELSESINSLLIDGNYADHFKYQLNIADANGVIITEGEWYSTLKEQDIRFIELTRDSEPAITPLSETESYLLKVYVVTKSGYEDINNPAELRFSCIDHESYPVTLLYNGSYPMDDNTFAWYYNNCWLLSENHYTQELPYLTQFIEIELPEEETEAGIHYATAFDLDLEDNYTAIYSEDLKVYLNWGYYGEYGFESNGMVEITNRITDAKINKCMNPYDTTAYVSEIEFYEIQLDGNAVETEYYGGAASEEIPGWLRIRAIQSNSQSLVLENLACGEHCFKVRAIDNFGNIDPEPEVMNFTIYPDNTEKSGLLLLDFDMDTVFSPDELIDELYLEAVSSYNGQVTVIDAEEYNLTMEYNNNQSVLHYDESILAESIYNDYEWIVIHNDNPAGYTLPTALLRDIRVMLRKNRQLLFTSGIALNNWYDDAFDTEDESIRELFEDYWGISIESADAIELISSSISYRPYLIGSDSVFPMQTDLDLELDPESIFVPIISLIYQGMGACSIFQEEFITADPVYLYRSKAVDFPSFPPSQEDFDAFNGKPVAIHNSYNGCDSWLITFCLSFMEKEDVAEMFSEIFEQEGE